MKLALIEPSKTGVEHISFNRAVAHGLQAASGNEMRLYCSSSQFNAMSVDMPWTCLPVVSITRRAFFRKSLVELLALTGSMLHARAHGFRDVMLLSIFTPLLGTLPLLARLSGTRVTVVLHGELDGLLDARRMKITSYGYWVKRFFEKKGFEKVNCVVLSKGIQQRLAELYPDCAAHTVAIDHPMEITPLKAIPRDITFATLGIATMERFEALYAGLAALPPSQRPGLHHIGMCEPAVFEQFKDVVTFSCRPGDSLSPQDYEAMAARVSHALVLYDPSEYQLRVSGAMIDALRTGARLIAYPCGYAKDLQDEGFDVTLVPDLGALMQLLTQTVPPAADRDAHSDTANLAQQAYSGRKFAERLLRVLA